MPAETVRVEVAYALPDKQTLIGVALPAGASLREAIERSGVLQQFPEIDLTRNRVGVFGKLKPLDAVVNDRDRVEIYRPLPIDPRDARRERVERERREKLGFG